MPGCLGPPRTTLGGVPSSPALCHTLLSHSGGSPPLPQAKVVPNNDKKRTYSVTYVPKVGGLHKVSTHSTRVSGWWLPPAPRISTQKGAGGPQRVPH